MDHWGIECTESQGRGETAQRRTQPELRNSIKSKGFLRSECLGDGRDLAGLGNDTSVSVSLQLSLCLGHRHRNLWRSRWHCPLRYLILTLSLWSGPGDGVEALLVYGPPLVRVMESGCEIPCKGSGVVGWSPLNSATIYVSGGANLTDGVHR